MVAHNLAAFLKQPVAIITGNMQFDEQVKILKQFQQGEFTVMITTNILIRAIDLPLVNLIINVDFPRNEFREPDTKSYVYRASRSGRFGKCFQLS